ncbi:MAG: DNA/RNA non-specific endonuclease [Pseudomonadota bacterium]
MTPRTYAATLALMLLPGLAAGHSSDGEPCPEIESFDIKSVVSEEIGEPLLHVEQWQDDTLSHDCHDRFCWAHSSADKAPIWVVERLNRSIACGDNERPSIKFKPEDKVDGYKAVDSDYTKSGFDRGHLAASADFKSNLDWMKQTFTFANAVPQIGIGFNRSYWRFLEDNIQHLALSGRDMMVITGPIPVDPEGKRIVIPASGQHCRHKVTLAGAQDLARPAICGAKDGAAKNDCEKGVAVPAGLFKIVYFRDSGRMFAFAMSNVDHRDLDDDWPDNDDYLDTWRVSVDAVEKVTGLEFFPEIDERLAKLNKRSCIATPRH